MSGKDTDQDALAAEWSLALDSDGTLAAEAPAQDPNSDVAEAVPGQWTGGADDFLHHGKGGAERILSQDEIDGLLGFSVTDVNLSENSGIRAIIDSAMVSYERLPMLEIVFDRLVRLLTTSLRNFTSDNVEISLDRITSVRFGDYLNSIPLPAILAVFKAEEWENFGLITVNSNLIYSIIDVLLGGRRGASVVRVEGRPYTTIESNLVKRMIEVILADAELAFRPLSPVKFNIDRLETNPRFAAITRPANAAILVRLRIDMEDRGGTAELLLPYATIEPIRGVLLQMFMGEKFGRDSIWEDHLATEISKAEVEVDAVLYEARLPLRQLMELKVGHTLPLEVRPDALVTVRCGDVTLTEGRMGRVGDRVAVRVAKPLRRPTTTFAMFENADETRARKVEAPVSYTFGLTIESLVAILLLLTIIYCARLNSRLERLRASESTMKTSIAELRAATEAAERAIAALKATVRDARESLEPRLREAESFSQGIADALKSGEQVMTRLGRIAAARELLGGAEDVAPAPVVADLGERSSGHDTQSMVAAAKAFAERARSRAKGLAA